MKVEVSIERLGKDEYVVSFGDETFRIFREENAATCVVRIARHALKYVQVRYDGNIVYAEYRDFKVWEINTENIKYSNSRELGEFLIEELKKLIKACREIDRMLEKDKFVFILEEI